MSHKLRMNEKIQKKKKKMLKMKSWKKVLNEFTREALETKDVVMNEADETEKDESVEDLENPN